MEINVVKVMLEERGIKVKITERRGDIVFELGDGKMRPGIHLDDAMMELSNGECVDRILESYKSAMDNVPNTDNLVDFIKDYENCKNALFLKLINPDRGHENCIKRSYLDLRLEIGIDYESDYSVAVTHEMLKVWKVSEDEVFAQAYKNCEGKYIITSIMASYVRWSSRV